MAIAELPLAKEIEHFDFPGTLIIEALIRHLADDTLILEQRNAV